MDWLVTVVIDIEEVLLLCLLVHSHCYWDS